MKNQESLKILKTDQNLILEGNRYVEMKRKSTTEKEPEEVSLKFGMVKWGTSSQIGTAPEFGPNDHREDTPHFTIRTWMSESSTVFNFFKGSDNSFIFSRPRYVSSHRSITMARLVAGYVTAYWPLLKLVNHF